MRPDLGPHHPGEVPDVDGGVSAEPLLRGSFAVVTQPPAGSPARVVIGPDDVDADGDGHPDTVVVVDSCPDIDLGAFPGTEDGGGLTLYTDLDGDGLADQELHIPVSRPAEPEPDAEPVWWQPWTWFAG